MPEKTLFVITTDGYENASRRYNYETVRRMIERQKEKYGWEFLFLGANIDAAKEAARFGIGADRAVNYKCDEAGTALNYEVISEAVCCVRAASPLSADWKRRIDEDVEKRGEINMYGAILGDIVGSPYEFDCNNYKAKDFPLFSQRSEFTDDTVMTLAVAKALLDTRGQEDAAIKAALVREMQRLGRAYPDRGYGVRFGGWLYADAPQPYQQLRQRQRHAGIPGGVAGGGHGGGAASGAAHRRGHPQPPGGHQGRAGHRRGDLTLPAPDTARRTSRRMWSGNSATISAAPATRFALPIIMWRAVRRRCRRPLPRFWKAQISRTLSARRYPSAATATRWPPSPAASPKAFYGVPEDLKQECRQRLTPELTEILLAFQNND